MEDIRRAWSQSKTFRAILIVAIVYAVLRLGVQGMIVSDPDLFPGDLRIYLEGANSLRARQPLYLTDVDQMEFFQYTPAYALAFVPFTWMSPTAVAAIQSVFHVVIYALLYVGWIRIFRRYGLERERRMMAWTLPVWLIFSEFWSDLGYLNFYIGMALLATLFLDAMLDERLGWSVLWLSVILQMKPQWAFVAAVPLLLGRYRFWLKLVGLAVGVYLGIAGITIVAVGPAYGWEQYVAYYGFLAKLSGLSFPWRTMADGFLGYNHSISQIVIYFLGDTPVGRGCAFVVKAILLLPLAGVAVRYLLWPTGRPGSEVPRLGIELTFALYLGAFIWLDAVWEVAMGIAVFTYLLAVLRERWITIVVWVVFMVYALVDLLRLVTFAVFPDAITPQMYFLTDPSVYVPVTMIVILTFYAILIGRLWPRPAVYATAEAG